MKNLPEEFKSGRWLMLCVRHSGCTFCREELYNFKKYEEQVIKKGFQPVVVHMGSEESGEDLRKKYQLSQTKFLSDPKKIWFKIFGFPRGNLDQLFGLKNLKQGIFGGSLFKFGIGPLEGDGFQLGGIAQLVDGKILVLHRAKYAGDLGDYSRIIQSL